MDSSTNENLTEYYPKCLYDGKPFSTDARLLNSNTTLDITFTFPSPLQMKKIHIQNNKRAQKIKVTSDGNILFNDPVSTTEENMIIDLPNNEVINDKLVIELYDPNKPITYYQLSEVSFEAYCPMYLYYLSPKAETIYLKTSPNTDKITTTTNQSEASIFIPKIDSQGNYYLFIQNSENAYNILRLYEGNLIADAETKLPRIPADELGSFTIPIKDDSYVLNYKINNIWNKYYAKFLQ